MKNSLTFCLLMCCAFLPLSAALPVILNSGDPASCGPGGLSGNNLSNPIGNTIYDSYYTSECFYPALSDHVILEPGIVAGTSYTLYLHFAEIFFGSGNPNSAGGDGSRIFHVEVEGERILDNFDVHANIGPSNAIVFRYDFTASTNGSVTVTFIPVVQNAKVSAIEIRTLGEASDLPPTTSIIDLTNPVFPVEWMEVDGRVLNEQAFLTWTTAWEQNNAGFDVQMAVPGEAYQSIGFVEGAGTTQEVTEYSFQSPTLSKGIHLFRLKQIDFDGMISISPTIELSVGADGAAEILSLSPNPATRMTTLTFIGEEEVSYTVAVRNMAGQELARFEGEMRRFGRTTEVDIDLTSLPSGLYVVTLRTDTEAFIRRMVVR